MTVKEHQEDMNNSTVDFNITEEFTDFASIKLTNLLSFCFFSLSAVFGLPAHSYVIWLIVRGSERRIELEFFNLNLFVCEIGFCLYCCLEILAMYFSSLRGLAYFFKGLGITTRPLFQCLMCVERYLAVVHPVTFLKYKPVRYRVICSIAAWIMSLGSCLCCMFICLLHASDVFAWFFSVQLILYLSVQLLCCLAVLRALKRSGPGERGREREEENHMKKRAFDFILITTVSMLIAYFPAIFLGFYILADHYVPAPLLIGFKCFPFAGFVHPVLYLYRAGKICCFSSS